MTAEFLIIVALVLVSGLLAGSEIALITVRKGRLRELVEDGSRAALVAQRLREHPERFLATVQVGITVIGATAAAFGGSTIARHIEPLFRRIPALAEEADELALGTVVVVVSLLSLILGELVPKSLALRSAERYALLVARPLAALAWIARPVVWFLTSVSNLVLRLFGDKTSFIEARLSGEELRGLVDEAARHGSVHAEAGEIASRALEFGELTAESVMVHRRFVVALPIDADAAQVRHVLLEIGHRRVPVYRDSKDNVVGYILWSDVVERVWDGRPIALEEVMRPGYFVPETTSAAELLEEMQKRRNHLAIVVDEHGGMAGIATLDDLLEELVGEIFSERDRSAVAWATPDALGTYTIPATVAIRDVNRTLEIELPEPDEWTTIGGLAIQLAGERIPAAGEQFTVGEGIVLHVKDASGRRVRTVGIQKLPGAGGSVSPG